MKYKNCHEIALGQEYFIHANLCVLCLLMKMKGWERQLRLPLPDWEDDPIEDVLSYDEAMEVRRQLRVQDLLSAEVPLLTALPTELLRAIFFNLKSDRRSILRSVTQQFSKLVPRPTFQELLTIDCEPWLHNITYACGCCVRLRHSDHFSMSRNCMWYDCPMVQGGRKSHTRFCQECGVRSLPGEFRYQLGDVWYDEEGVCR